ncbi:DUF2304 domain-containing protein [Candidatus Saccharibacteria bacterium]|nr:DUF2304 domain-containing protein [Candidatus Saccharibacteria bacterium]
MTNIQIEMAISAIILFIIIIICLVRNSMSIKNSIAWLILPIVFVLIAIFPEPLTTFAHWLGFETLANFIFLITIALLIVLCFFLTLTVSKQQQKITKLIQELSIIKKKQK